MKIVLLYMLLNILHFLLYWTYLIHSIFVLILNPLPYDRISLKGANENAAWIRIHYLTVRPLRHLRYQLDKLFFMLYLVLLFLFAYIYFLFNLWKYVLNIMLLFTAKISLTNIMLAVYRANILCHSVVAFH